MRAGKRPVAACLLLLISACGRNTGPSLDAHTLAEEVHHNPELARKIISEVVSEQHGIALVAEELGKNEMAATKVVDELMKNPEIAKAIEDRCSAANIAKEVERK